MDRRAEWTTAALAAVMLCALAPLGLASGESADQAAQALGVRRAFGLHTPVADTLARLAVLLPVGEVGTRPQWVGIAAGAGALALLVARLKLAAGRAPRGDAAARAAPDVPGVGAGSGRVTGSGGGAASGSAAGGGGGAGSGRVAGSGGIVGAGWGVGAGAGAGPGAGAALGMAAAVALVGSSRPFVEVACLRPALAVDLALLMALGLLLELTRRAPTRPAAGLVLGFACGAATGAGWPVRVATWPLALALTVLALRRGRRWPLLSPTLFVAGTAIALGALVGAAAGPTNTVGALLRGTAWPGAPGTIQVAVAARALRGAAGDAGILVVLVAALGCFVWFRRAPTQAILAVVVWGTAVAAALAQGDVLFARLILLVAMATPVAAAIGYLAQPFGRAAAASAAVMAVVVVLPPAIVGLGAAVSLPARSTPQAVSRRLDAAVRVPGAAPPSDLEAARWLRYGRAIGLEPPASQ